MNPPKITKSTFNALQKKYKEELANPKEVKKKETKKKEKKSKNPKDFAAHVDDMDAYHNTCQKMKAQIGSLGEAPITLVNNTFARIDNTSGQLCLVWAIGIPHKCVGTKRSQGIKPGPEDFYGCFAHETSLFYYLRYILGVDREHPLVKHSREYYKISPKVFETKFSEENLRAYAEALNKSKVNGIGTGSIPYLSQFGRGKKFLKTVWYFNRKDVPIPDNLNWIDTDELLHDNGLEKGDVANFYSYEDFTEQQTKVSENKKENSAKNKYWKQLIEEMGPEEAAAYFSQHFPQSTQPFGAGKKRKASSSNPTQEDTSSSSSVKAQKIEEDKNLHETMKDIEGLILRSSACNFYSDEDSTGDEEEEESSSQQVFENAEEINLESSESESSEEEQKPTTPPLSPTQSKSSLQRKPSMTPSPSKNRAPVTPPTPPKPHVVQKGQPSSSSTRLPTPQPRRGRSNK